MGDTTMLDKNSTIDYYDAIGKLMDGIKKDHCLSNNEIVDAVYVCLFSHQAKILNSIAIENKS